jgi:IS30 family transposase
MGMARQVTEHERVQIAAGFASGMSPAELVRKYGRARNTIYRVISTYKGTPAFDTVKSLRADLEHRSVNALKTALAPTKDIDQAIKQAPVACQVLKGIGVFASETQAAVSITFEPGSLDWMQAKQVGASSTPAALQAECTVIDPAPVDVV